MEKFLIRNIGQLISGDLSQPILEADSILIEDGIIKKIFNGQGLNEPHLNRTIDVKGMTVAPGLIDSHCHPVIGDYTPRQKQIDFIASSMLGGITTMISAGEVHTPGRPRDAAGTKALAILTAKSYANFRPEGVKVLGGGLILESGLREEDFAEMANEGVTHLGEIGLGSVVEPEEAIPMVRWAKKYGMIVMMHVAGVSVPSSSTVSADQVLAVGPDVVAHLNGAPTSIPLNGIEKIIRDSDLCFEITYMGNFKMALEIVRIAKEEKAFDRILLGIDGPAGEGVAPLGILRIITLIVSVGGVKPASAIAMATGNTARVYNLNRGLIKEGFEADLVVMDSPVGSAGRDALEAIEYGDIPGIAAVIIDGNVRSWISRNAPPPVRSCQQVG
jgi:enamidase